MQTVSRAGGEIDSFSASKHCFGVHSVGFQYASSLQRRRDSFLKIMNRNVVLAWELWHGDLGDEVGQAILKQQKQQLTQRQTWGNTTIFSLFIIITSVIQMLIFNKRCNKQARLTYLCSMWTNFVRKQRVKRTRPLKMHVFWGNHSHTCHSLLAVSIISFLFIVQTLNSKPVFFFRKSFHCIFRSLICIKLIKIE